MEKYYKISDFAKQVGKHQNTVDNWFKQLEEKKIHFVNRAGSEKVYNDLDLEIAQFIFQKRNEKWALEAIFNELEARFELRPFPKEMDSTNTPQMIDIEAIKQQMRVAFEEIASAKIAEVHMQYQEIIKSLPQPMDEAVARQQRITDLITQKRVETRLEKEALELWRQKPESERMRKIGLFRKEEDREEKERFIKSFINEHFEKYLKEEYRLTDQ